MKPGDNYGKELILDLHDCIPELFNEEDLTRFFVELCDLIDMQREQLNFWGYDDPEEKAAAPPHLKGISGVQFIQTSNITIHALDDLKAVYLNIFSCKDFIPYHVMVFARKFFGGTIVQNITHDRI